MVLLLLLLLLQIYVFCVFHRLFLVALPPACVSVFRFNSAFVGAASFLILLSSVSLKPMFNPPVFCPGGFRSAIIAESGYCPASLSA